MGEMATGMAHELNQPLTAITNFCEASLSLLSQEDQKPLLAKTLRQTSHQAKRAAEIISRIRNFARKDQAQTEQADIAVILQNALEYAGLRLTGQQVHIELDLPDEAINVTVCVVQIEQVALNLILNALDALRSEGAVENRLQLSAERVRDHVLVTVRDFGPGVSHRMLPVLFDPFESNKPEGLGMGLSVSRSIMEAHQGRLWLDEGVVPGACFRFSLPASEL